MKLKGFNSDFIEELKQKSDIVSVISKYIPLEKKGRNFWGRCPFHHEKTPSFSVNQQNQFYHCFGCSVSGDVIKFVMEMESIEFIDAVKILCEQTSMKMPQIKVDDAAVEASKKQKERLYSLMRDCAKFYYTSLFDEENKRALNYFLNRGISKEYITKFGLGFCPDYDSSIEYLKSLGYTNDEMLASGVAAEKNGRLYDVLGGRLIFPILNSFSEVLAFGGRLFEKSGFAKYRNTQETKLFNKSKNLYGINLVKKQKQQVGIASLIIVEGYMDTIALYQSGFTNVVASMGTSLTKDQARLVKRFADNVFICYDGDAAGKKATIRGLDILKEEGLNVKVIDIPDGLDPDEYINKHGKEAYQRCIDNALLLIDFKLNVLLNENDIKSTEGKRKFVQEALRVVLETQSVTEQEDLLKKIREITGFTYESLKRDLENFDKKEITAPPRYVVDVEPVSENKYLRFIMYCMLNEIADYKDFDRVLPYIEKDIYKAVFNYLKECKEKSVRPKASMLYEYAQDDEYNEITAILSAADSFENDSEILQYYEDCIKIFLKMNLEDRIKKLTDDCTNEINLESRKKLLQKLQELTTQLKNL